MTPAYQSCVDNLVVGDIVELNTYDDGFPIRVLVLGHWKLRCNNRIVPVAGIQSYSSRINFYYPEDELYLSDNRFPTRYCVPLWHTYHCGILKIFKKTK